MKKQRLLESIVCASVWLLLVGCDVGGDLDPDMPSDTLAESQQVLGLPATYRIAYTSDGNYNDPDDIGATPMALAIIAEYGAQSKLVHVSYNNILGRNTPEAHAEHSESVLGAVARFGFDPARFFSAYDDPESAVNNLKNAINASAASNPLYVLLAGPVEVAYRALVAADPAKRQYVTVISHVWWNDYYDVFVQPGDPVHQNKGKQDVIALGVNWLQIKNQNTGLCVGQCARSVQVPLGDPRWAPYAWLEASGDEDLHWLWDRLVTVGRPDPSDAGVAYFLFTGSEIVVPDDRATFPTGFNPPYNANYTLKKLLHDHVKPPVITRSTILMEAENFRLSNYVVDYASTYSQHGAVKCTASAGTVATLTTTFNELHTADATYSIAIKYLDESSGSSTYRLFVNGTQRDVWTASANDNTWKTRTKSGVTVRRGYQIRLEVTKNGSELCKVDTIKFTRTGNAVVGQ